MLSVQHAKKRHPGASCALLLVAASAGATFGIPWALAQPALPAQPGFQLPPTKKATFRRIVDLANMENVCKSSLDLQVKDATLDDVITRVKKVIPATTLIEVRKARPVRVSFDLPGTTAGGVLGTVGSLAGCKLWVFDDRLLLAPSEELTAAEKADTEKMMGGEWSRNVAAGGSGWWARGNGQTQLLLAMADVFNQQAAKAPATPGVMAQPLSNKPAPAVILFGDLSPDAQAIMHQLVGWAFEGAHAQDPDARLMNLSSNTKIIFDKSHPPNIGLQAKNDGDSDAASPSVGWSYSN